MRTYAKQPIVNPYFFASNGSAPPDKSVLTAFPPVVAEALYIAVDPPKDCLVIFETGRVSLILIGPVAKLTIVDPDTEADWSNLVYHQVFADCCIGLYVVSYPILIPLPNVTIPEIDAFPVTVNMPVTTAPWEFAWTFTSLPFLIDDESALIPVNWEPSPK